MKELINIFEDLQMLRSIFIVTYVTLHYCRESLSCLTRISKDLLGTDCNTIVLIPLKSPTKQMAPMPKCYLLVWHQSTACKILYHPRQMVKTPST